MDIVSTTVLLDRERSLKVTYDSIEQLANLTLARRAGRSPIELWQHANGLDVSAMGMLIWALTRHESDPGFTLDRAQAAVRAALKGGRTTYKALNEALNAAMNQSGMLGLFNPEVDTEAVDPTPPKPAMSSRAGDSLSPSE